MTELQPDISVIIVSWNVRDYLRRCLASIDRFARDISIEIFVVDNNSSDGSAAMVRSEFPRVRLIENGENAGFAKANNQALKFCAGRNILFLNPDTELLDNAFKQMVDFMEAYSDAAAMAPKLLNSDGSLQHSYRYFPSFFTDLMENLYLDYCFPRSVFFNRYHMGFRDCATACKIDVPYGACLLVRSKALRLTGPMDERFFMYYDEIDLCYRIKKTGGGVYFVPSVRVMHHSNKSSSQAGAAEEWKLRSKILFFRKRYGRLGLYGLIFNLALQGSLVWGALSMSYLLTKHPRHLAETKRLMRRIWWEYMNSFRERT